MRIIVLGSGAIGSLLAAHLSSAGADVSLISRGRRAKYLQKNGIDITGLTTLRAHCHITTQPKDLNEADFLIVAVKTYDMEAALSTVSHLNINAALSVQNGVLKNEQLRKTFGKGKVLGASAFISGELTPAGGVRFTFNDNFFVGEFPEGISRRVDRLVTYLKTSGINAEAVSNIQTIEWSKFVGWVALMSLAVLTRMETHAFLSNADFSLLGVRIMQETALLSKKYGVSVENDSIIPIKTIIELPESQAAQRLREVGAMMRSRAPNHKVSALQDLEHGRRLEVEETLGYVVRNAAEQNISVPTVETVYFLIRAANNYTGPPEKTSGSLTRQ